MPKASDKPLEKVTIRLYEGDAARLNALFPTLGYNAVIRTLVGNFLKGVDEKVSQKHTTQDTNIQINMEDINDADK